MGDENPPSLGASARQAEDEDPPSLGASARQAEDEDPPSLGASARQAEDEEENEVKHGFTERKVKILQLLIVDGLTRKEIASRLGIAAQTVSFHVNEIYHAFGISQNPWVCARKAIALGIVKLPAEDFGRVLRVERVLREVAELLKSV